jgi:hypothetical protein
MDAFSGALREVRVWDRAPTEAKIRDGAGRTLAGTEPGLIAYWPLDEGSGRTAARTATTSRSASRSTTRTTCRPGMPR